MITVDRIRCAYCGGCVSVCPRGALTLEETRLVAGRACDSCGVCLAACPMGALRLAGAERTADVGPRGPSRSRYDVVIVGAGPGGATAAEEAAREGLSALLLEKRQEIGSPVRCAEGVGHAALVTFLEPDPRWVAAEVGRAQITAVGEGATRRLTAEGGRGYVLERRVFDRALAERAAAAGAEVRVKTAVTGLILEGGQVRGVRLRGPDGGEVHVEARVVVAADGVEAQVGRWAGLDVALPLRDTMVCAQYLLAGVDLDPACTYYWIGEDVAPGGYAWAFPKGQGRANVGLGVQANLTAQAKRSALGYLNRFVAGQPALARGHPVTLVAGNVPVALPPARMVAGGLVLVGDAARQVDPLTGGGIVNAMDAGRLAARVISRAIAAGDTSAQALAPYEEAWRQGTGRKMERNYRLRQRFSPAERTDERFLRAFALAVG